MIFPFTESFDVFSESQIQFLKKLKNSDLVFINYGFIW